MKEVLVKCSVLLLSFLFQQIAPQLRTNFVVKRFEKCYTGGPVEFYGNFTKENRNQYLDFNLTTSVALDDNIGFVCQIDSVLSEKTTVPLFTIREKRFCEAANKYMGEFWYDIERAAQLPPGVCPIRAGRYHVHHLLVHFEKITLQTFPFGTLRLTMQAIEKGHNKTVFCIMVDVENVPN